MKAGLIERTQNFCWCCNFIFHRKRLRLRKRGLWRMGLSNSHRWQTKVSLSLSVIRLLESLCYNSSFKINIFQIILLILLKNEITLPMKVWSEKNNVSVSSFVSGPMFRFFFSPLVFQVRPWLHHFRSFQRLLHRCGFWMEKPQHLKTLIYLCHFDWHMRFSCKLFSFSSFNRIPLFHENTESTWVTVSVKGFNRNCSCYSWGYPSLVLWVSECWFLTKCLTNIFRRFS